MAIQFLQVFININLITFPLLTRRVQLVAVPVPVQVVTVLAAALRGERGVVEREDVA